VLIILDCPDFKEEFYEFSQFNGLCYKFKEQYNRYFLKDARKIHEWIVDYLKNIKTIFYNGNAKIIDFEKISEKELQKFNRFIEIYNTKTNSTLTTKEFYDNYIRKSHIEFIHS
jgi:hypothetical protein